MENSAPLLQRGGAEMDRTVNQWRFKQGDEVCSADDHKLGKVVRLLPDTTAPTHLVVERGVLFKHDYRIPVDRVTNYNGRTIYLDVIKSFVDRAGWDVSPGRSDEPASATEQP
jgi:hypothetical protein